MNHFLSVRELHARHAFRIARPRTQPLCNVYLRLEHAGAIGYGEASPNAYYGETAELVLEKLRAAAGLLQNRAPSEPEDIARFWEEVWPVVQPSRGAQCALDLALWDWLARRRGQSVSEVAWGAPPKSVRSFGTIGLSTPEEWPVKMAELRAFAQLKIKADQSGDFATARFARTGHRGLLAVDANASWDLDRLPALATEAASLPAAFLEQPLPPAQDARLVRGAYALPVMADESCVVETDVERVCEHFDGFNIKLVKCGGLTPALRMLRRGRELGRTVMAGCMLESSLLIAAGFVLAQQTDFADLDGAWLLGDDPFLGLPLTEGQLTPPNEPGFGVNPIPNLFGS